MKLQIERQHIQIIPENKVDEAYLEEVLGLKNDHATAIVRRHNISATNSLAYISIEAATAAPQCDYGGCRATATRLEASPSATSFCTNPVHACEQHWTAWSNLSFKALKVQP